MFTAGVTLAFMGALPIVLRHLNAFSLMTPFSVVLALVFGGALGAVLIPAFTVLQERTTTESRGRIFGGIFTVINAAVAVPLVAAGVLADIFGVDRVIGALGLLLIGLAIGVRMLGWRQLAVLEEDGEAVSLSVVDPT